MTQVYQPEDLSNIDEAFEQAWAVIASDPNRDAHQDEYLKALLREKLLTVAAAGVEDVELMRKMALGAIDTAKSA
jgi:hypothetical protein